MDAKKIKRKKIDERTFWSGMIVVWLSILMFTPLFIFIFIRQSQGLSPAEFAMPDMNMAQMGVYWSYPILQASGIIALFWSYLSVLLGLMTSSKGIKWLPIKKAKINSLHRQISLLVIGMILVHAVATSFNNMGDSFITSFIPWQAPWEGGNFSYNLGIFGFYLAILLGPTFYLRSKLSTKAWLFAHRFTLLIYILSLWHTLVLGTNISYYSWVEPFIWILQIPLLLLLIRRLLKSSISKKKYTKNGYFWNRIIRYGMVGLCGGAIIIVFIIILTGNTGFLSMT
ncbi:ferric reductase-like transmembrane domain-containing protein [Staphylococcus lloydii]|nr:ferric reductase-like transmembrane domain-containing protein [Staphylococcus lloydii]